MTIALGLLALDGAVVGADTEIGASIELKSSDTKIVTATFAPPDGTAKRALALAGAGSLGHFESIRMLLANAIIVNATHVPASENVAEAELNRIVGEFYTSHVIPFYAYPSPPDVYMLAAFWAGGRGILWASDRTAIRRSFDYDAVGVGGSFAKDLLAGRALPNISVESAALLACYTLMRVKATIQGCGQESQIIVVREGSSTHLSWELVDRCEHAFKKFADVQSELFNYVSGRWPNRKPLNKSAARLRREFDTLRQEIKEISSATDYT